jgi:crotonobetainyl-CoA:carnitine CoA-transferase CaiB-like acyl-CoA transferase
MPAAIFATSKDREAHDDVLASAIAAGLSSRSALDWEQLLTAENVGCVKVFEISDPEGTSGMAGMVEFTYTDPVLRQTGLVAEVDHPVFGRILRHGIPAAFSETPGRVAPGCALGQHTERILAELGCRDDEVAALVEEGSVFVRSATT